MDFQHLITKVQAEGADTLASPTFPFTPPAGWEDNQQSSSDTNNIRLETDSTTVQVQKRIIVRIFIDATKDKISSFTVNVSFDPNLLQVIDSDTTESGIQINFLDSVFDVSKNSVNNSTGIITLQAKVENTDQATTLSRSVAEIEFIAIQPGASEVKIIKENSNLANSSSVDVLNSVNSINLNITSSTQENTQDNQSQENTIYIPKTALSQDMQAFLSILVGILLILSGLYVIKFIKDGKSKSH